MSADLLSPAWWTAKCNLSPAARKVIARVGGIAQANSSVTPYSVALQDGRVIHTVIKTVNLCTNRYRSAEHRNRSLKSYQVEVMFYKRFSQKLQKANAKVPKILYHHWEADNGGLTLVLEDLSCQVSAEITSADVTRLTHQALALDSAQAALALQWLSRMHAAFWQEPTSSMQHIWPQGSYWSLEKRQNDVLNMVDQWSKTVAAFGNAFPHVFGKQSVQKLGQRLANSAQMIQQLLQESGVPSHHNVSTADHSAACTTASPSSSGWTIIHGDFKTANLFFSPTADAASSIQQSCPQPGKASVSACDFQWCGGGIGEQDVMYLLWSSLDPAVVMEQEQKLLRTYHDHLQHALAVQKGENANLTYSFEFCWHRYQLSFLDYVRFLVGAMWGNVTPATCEALQRDLNQGMHKRSAKHLVHMVSKADNVLQQLEDLSVKVCHAQYSNGSWLTT